MATTTPPDDALPEDPPPEDPPVGASPAEDAEARARHVARAQGLRLERTQTLVALGSMVFGAVLLIVLSVAGRHSAGGDLVELAGIVGLLLTLNLILAVEREAESAPGDRLTMWRGVLVLGAVLLAAEVCLSVALHGPAAWPVAAGAGGLRWFVLAMVFISAVVAVLTFLRVRRGLGPEPAPAEYAVRAAPSGRSLAVACSGGGIRAASFVLGSINGLQSSWDGLVTRAEGTTPDGSAASTSGSEPDSSEDPLLVAVSGGSYTAAGMSLVRRFAAQPGEAEDIQVGGTPEASLPSAASTLHRRPPLGWREAFAPDSPELGYLRRHTRDLFEPRRELLSGLVGLFAGAALNIVILLGVLTATAWADSWLAATSGVLGIEGARLTITNPIDFGARAPANQWIGWVFVVLAAAALVATLGAWQDRRTRDAATSGEPPRSRGVARMRSAQLGVVALAAVWLVVMLAVPAAVAGLTNAAADNQPTALVAKALHQAGFSTPAMCEEAAGDSVLDAARAARADALVSPGETREYVAGACGFTAKVSLRLVAPAGTCPLDGSICPDRGDERWRQLGADLIVQADSSKPVGTPSQIAGLVAILGAVTGLLRAASGSAGGAAASGVVATLRRLVLGWLPPLVVFLVLSWYVLSRMFDTAIAAVEVPSTDKVLLPLAALICAAWQDANVTSMHTYYRHRLSNAFAVGRRDGADGQPAVAHALDDDVYYRFSDLGPVGLRVATTANIRAYGQAPTRRGGVPLTFDAENVVLQAPGGTVPVADYERAAGLGRTTVMAAVAISGAAVSPMAGRFATRIGPFRLLLTLFNIRIGVWALNPLWVDTLAAAAPGPRAESDETTPTSPGAGRDGRSPGLLRILRGWPGTPWLIRRPGTVQVVAEAFGASSMHDRWLYLSDGGHLDNTGMVEAVRSLLPLPDVDSGEVAPAGPQRWALVIDASNDATGTWTAVGDALSVVGADLGVQLHRVSDDPQLADAATSEPASAGPVGLFRRRRPDQPSTREFARRYRTPDGVLEVLVVKAVRPADVPSSILPDSVRAFAMTHPDFPRAATTRQDFGDLEFEAYRMLGQVYTELALATFWRGPARARAVPSAGPSTHRSPSGVHGKL